MSIIISPDVLSQDGEIFLPRDPKYSPHIAQYPGGEVGWFKTVEEKVDFRSFPRKKQNDTISIVMQFFVPINGKIEYVIFSSGEKRIEQQIRKILLASGIWIPARQGGRSVKSYRKVKLYFRFDRTNKRWTFDTDASAYFVL